MRGEEEEEEEKEREGGGGGGGGVDDLPTSTANCHFVNPANSFRR